MSSRQHVQPQISPNLIKLLALSRKRMASTSHSGQIKNSHSPSVIALSSTKAPSTAAAKPRFRSRTGCWTCRKRKVKCDERGRNPETVAYGGQLSTSSGCKRCEDSGRPCRGYGAQPPSESLITHYASSHLNRDSSLGGTPFYTFSSHTHAQDKVPNMSATFPAIMNNVEPDPRYIPHSMQWAQPFEHSLPENQVLSYGLRMPRNAPPCSTSASVGELINRTSVSLPSVDLRRFSVPNYSTWQGSPQPRNIGLSYAAVGLPGNAFSLDQGSSTYDNMEEVIPPTNVASAYERPDSNLQVNECNALSADAYQNIAQNDISPVYSHDMSESDTQSVSFDFTRPHTSSGITLSYDDSQSHQNLCEPYGSPTNASLKELECIEKSSGATSTSLLNYNDASIQAWPGPQTSSGTFRRLSSVLNNHSLNPVQTSLFSTHAQVNDTLKCQSSESFKKTGGIDIPLFPSMRERPYDVLTAHTSHHPTSASAVCQGDAVLSIERCCSDSVNQSTTERPLSLFQMDRGCPKTLSEMMSHESHDTLRLNPCSYMRSCPLPIEGESQSHQSPIRKESSSSLSSHSTQEHNLSPAAIATQHPSAQNTCSTSPSLSSQNPVNQFYRLCISSQRLSCHNPSITTTDLSSQPGHPERWAPHGLIHSLENPPYDYRSILDPKANEFRDIDVHEDDSPTSTAPSNTSGAPGAT